jgi:hypothetical protein
VGRLRIKKKKPKQRQQTAPAQTGAVSMVGFPEFWQAAFNLNRGAFEEVRRIGEIQNKIFTTAPENPLERVLRHLARNAINTLGAALTLCLNGYGHDAMKLAHSTYEAHLNAAYLEKHPDEIDDYIDFYHVLVKDELNYLDQSNPTLTEELPADRREEINKEYDRVKSRFTGKRRNHWAKRSIWEMAEDVGLKEHHKTFYKNASNMHHSSVWGLQNQVEDATGDAEIAPSTQWVTSALFSAHTYALDTMAIYNRVAHLGHDATLKEARQNFINVWKTEIGEPLPAQ